LQREYLRETRRRAEPYLPPQVKRYKNEKEGGGERHIATTCTMGMRINR
jgi:hypothetical protein